MSTDKTRQQSLDIVRTLRSAGHEALWAGGSVRDALLGRPAKDFDIATSATPDQVRALFRQTVEVGAAFGVLLVVIDGTPHEVATFRRDLPYPDGRHPEGVVFTGPEEDAKRRDFTINGMFMDPETGRVIDFVGGQEDLRRKLVRTIGSPEDRFSEDYLRMLRGVRLAAVLEFEIDDATAAAIRTLAPRLRKISAERIQQEVSRILLEAPRAGQALLLMHSLGLVKQILPEVAAMDGQEQPPQFHPEGDVLTHTAMMLDGMSEPDLSLAYSVLLHDVGKPPTARRTREPDGTERIRFNRHAKVGADIAQRILKRLKMPKRIVEAVTHNVANHMRFMDVPNMRQSTLRRMMAEPTFPTELELHRLDCLCSHGDLGNYELLQQAQRDLAAEPSLPGPWVTGHDLLELGLKEGPAVGEWYRRAYDRQLEGQAKSREELLAWLRSELTDPLERS